MTSPKDQDPYAPSSPSAYDRTSVEKLRSQGIDALSPNFSKRRSSASYEPPPNANDKSAPLRSSSSLTAIPSLNTSSYSSRPSSTSITSVPASSGASGASGVSGASGASRAGERAQIKSEPASAAAPVTPPAPPPAPPSFAMPAADHTAAIDLESMGVLQEDRQPAHAPAPPWGSSPPVASAPPAFSFDRPPQPPSGGAGGASARPAFDLPPPPRPASAAPSPFNLPSTGDSTAAIDLESLGVLQEDKQAVSAPAPRPPARVPAMPAMPAADHTAAIDLESMGVLQEDREATPAPAPSDPPPWAAPAPSDPPPWAAPPVPPAPPAAAAAENSTQAIDLDSIGLLNATDKLASQTPPAPPPIPAAPLPAPTPAAQEPEGHTQAIDLATFTAPDSGSRAGISGEAPALPPRVPEAVITPAAPPPSFGAPPGVGASTSLIDISLMGEPLSGMLLVEAGDTNQRELKLGHDRTTIGRDDDCQIVMPGKDLSRMHMVFERKPQGFSVRDLQSSNGTFVNGRRIVYAELRDNDVIEVGRFRFKFKQRGGDPNQLWRGAPRLDIHPNDHPNARAAMLAAMNNAAVPNHALQSQSTLSVIPAFTPGAKGMSASNPAITNPRLMATEASIPTFAAVQRKGPPMWAIVTIATVLMLAVAAAVITFIFLDDDDSDAQAATSQQREENKREAQALADKALSAFNAGQWTTALKHVTTAIDLDPTNKPALVALEARIRDEQAASEALREALGVLARAKEASGAEGPTLAARAVSDLLLIKPESAFLRGNIQRDTLPLMMSDAATLYTKAALAALEAQDPDQARALLDALDALTAKATQHDPTFSHTAPDLAAITSARDALNPTPAPTP